jgi:hypothetical protein
MGHLLIYGKNDLYTWCLNNGEYGEQLLNEYSPENYESIQDTFFGSTKKRKWICTKDSSHMWEATVGSRTTNKRGCPYCNNKKVLTGQNDLYTWCMKNSEWGTRLISEWDETTIDIHEIAPFSTKNAHWKCKNGHEWDCQIYLRTNKQYGCPYCSGVRITEDNNLYNWAINNNKILLDEWLGINSNGDYIDIHEVHSNSHMKVFWKCKNKSNHIWEATIQNRTTNNSKCPYCINRRILPGQNDLETWCINNGMLGDKIIKQWTGEEVGNSEIIHIDNVAIGSNKLMKWVCDVDNSHTWTATIYDRTSKGIGCPFCNVKGTSYAEQVIYRYYKQIYQNTISRGKFQGYEFDITIPELKTCIEYNGSYWHNIENAKIRDKEKAELCIEHNVKLITIIECNYIEDDTNDTIYVLSSLLHKQDYMIKLIGKINNLIGCNIADINKLSKAMNDASEFMKGR